MTSFKILFAASVWLLLTALQVSAQPLTRHVLFLGKSYVYTNNMPQMAVDIAASVLIPLPPNDSLMITEAGLYGVTVEHPSCPGYMAAQYLNINFVFIDCETGIPNGPLAASINVFPNPANDYVTIRNNGTANVNYSIVDATGRLVLNGILAKGENVISISGFANGVYIVKFEQPGLQPIKLIKL